jgi:hypothetical protein
MLAPQTREKAMRFNTVSRDRGQVLCLDACAPMRVSLASAAT